MLKIENLKVNYGGIEAVKGISFEDKNAGVDAVSGATISSTSVTKAVRIAFETLNK